MEGALDVGDESQGPKYKQIADALRFAIESGDYGIGDRLPSESALVAEWDTSRTTVRQALAILAEEGLTESRKGSGVRVRDPNLLPVIPALEGFKPIVRVETTRGSAWKLGKSMWEYDAAGREFATDEMDISYPDAPRRVARVLETPQAGLRSRRYLVDRRPGLLADSYLPADIVRNTRIMEPDTGAGGIYARLAELGFPVAAFRMQVWARESTPSEAKRLAVPARSFLLCAARTAFTAEGRAVEVNEMAMNPAMYVLQFDWDA